MITMTTVGYGEYYAQSHAGRVIATTTAFLGILITSFFIIACNNTLNLDPSDEKAYYLLKILNLKDS